jgi:hypothetical protein
MRKRARLENRSYSGRDKINLARQEIMLKFVKNVPYVPDPIQAGDGVPGWTLSYGYLTPITITGSEDGQLEVANLAQLVQETGQPHLIDQFASGHYSISSGYTLWTPPGYVSLILPATAAPGNLEVVIGVIESDWYPKELFLVFRLPPAGAQIMLDYGMPLARVVVVPRQADWTAELVTVGEGMV